MSLSICGLSGSHDLLGKQTFILQHKNNRMQISTIGNLIDFYEKTEIFYIMWDLTFPASPIVSFLELMADY